MHKLPAPLLITVLFISLASGQNSGRNLVVKGDGYFCTQGLEVLVFNNFYDGNFSDAKISGVEIIQHGVRTATNGDVRLSPTPGQWDPVPVMTKRSVGADSNLVVVSLHYPEYSFTYEIHAQAEKEGVVLSVVLPKPLPASLVGRAGLNLEFLPSAYFEKTYIMDSSGGVFPLYPSGTMARNANREIEPEPIVSGTTLVLAPEDPIRRVDIDALKGRLSLYDGRNLAQNGWFVVRSILPPGKTGTVVEWYLHPNVEPGWIRTPVIEYSQAGYLPHQSKSAVIELDTIDHPQATATVLRVLPNGSRTPVLIGPVKSWGKYLRYKYALFDFSSVHETGVYQLQYGAVCTGAFRIDRDIFASAWWPTLDVYLPVQMDHMFVREAYRIWHGAAHLDDALQAPVNHVHFDLYAQGPTTDSPYKPGEHIPGLNVGGWFDAGDYDIRTQTQCSVILSLAQTWEAFKPLRDETTINETTRYAEMHRPDGIPDIVQQVKHGVLQLLGQQKNVGHAINGIIEAHLYQYRLLGDASTNTDNLVYDPKLDSLQSDGRRSGTFDDRWAFTSKSSSLNYASAAALAAASRVLRGYDDSLSHECLTTSEKIWSDEQSHKPDLFHHGNTTGGSLEGEEFKAAVELLVCTKNSRYADAINTLVPTMRRELMFNAAVAAEGIPFMDEAYRAHMHEVAVKFRQMTDTVKNQNPFGVPVTTGGWAGSGFVVGTGITNVVLQKWFPDVIDPDYTLKALDYIYGCHPGSNVSFVSGVGTVSKKIAYGNNRADFSFIAGGVVPGVLVLKPDFPENKEDWPFLWGENEYVVSLGASYIYLVNAANAFAHEGLGPGGR